MFWQPEPQRIARADRPTIVAQRLTAPRLLLLGADKFVIGFSLFFKACQALANLCQRAVGLVVALDEFDCDSFKPFESVLHGGETGTQVVQGEVDQPHDKPGSRNRSSGGKTVFVKKVGKIQPIPPSCYPFKSASTASHAVFQSV